MLAIGPQFLGVGDQGNQEDNVMSENDYLTFSRFLDEPPGDIFSPTVVQGRYWIIE